MTGPGDTPPPSWYDPPEGHDASACETCEAHACDGEGFIPGTQELCCPCEEHEDPVAIKAMRDDELYQRIKEEGWA